MPLTFLYSNPHFGFKRSYLSGFVGSVNTSFMSVAGNTLEFYYLYPTYRIVLTMNDWFWPPSSNHYTVDYIFDPALSEAYAGSVPVGGSVGIKFVAMSAEPTWRVQVLSTLAINESVKADLPKLANYWRPLWP